MKLDRYFKVFTFSIFLLFSEIALAQPLKEIPDQLKKWQGWVLRDVEQFSCLSSWNNHQDKLCQWPGTLKLAIGKNKGTFEIDWTLYEEGNVELPGSQSGLWPENVKTNKGTNLVVVENQSRPTIFLKAGKHTIRGEFNVSSKSDRLTLPRGVGAISFEYNGDRVSFPEYDRQGKLLFKRKNPASRAESDSLQLKVFRKLTDSIPSTMEVYMELSVSGGEREVTLKNPLPEDFIPMELTSSLSARLEKGNEIKVQVRPGPWFVSIKGRSQRPLSKVSFEALSEPFPTQEVWVFQSNNELRLVDISGADQIDGERANLPSSFKGYPSYLLKKGMGLEFKEKSRGLTFEGKNKLSLDREMWLDFDGSHFTLQDEISGEMKKDWRIDMAKPYELGSVKISGKGQVITNGEKEGHRGVEIRKENILIMAQSRLNNSKDALSNLGWQTDFHQVLGKIHLPPGHEALWLGGADHVSGTWFSKWSLLSLFLVLLLSIGVTKLKDIKWGLITFVAMVLLIHEEGAPTTLWVHLLIALALERALTAKEKFSKIVRYYRVGTILVLLGVVFPFVIQQIQTAIFPSLERQGGRQQFMSSLVGNYDSMNSRKAKRKNVRRSARKKEKSFGKMAEESVQELGAMEDMAVQADFAGSGAAPLKGAPSSVATQSNAWQTNRTSYASYDEYDPKAIVQTGPGLPQWRWGTLTFKWDGPVSRDQKINLIYLRPWAKKILVLLRLIFLGLLMFCLMDWESLKNNGQLKFLEELLPKRRSGGLNSLGLLILFGSMLGLTHSPPLKAQDFPSPEILKDYRDSLLKAPKCYPQCGSIESASMQATNEQLEIRLKVHMVNAGFIAIPGNPKDWMPNIVLQNGREALIREHSNHLVVALDQGVQNIVMRGKLPSSSQVQLDFPVRPYLFSYKGKLWSLDGLNADGKIGGTLTLIRKSLNSKKSQNNSKVVAPSQLPAFLKIDRTFIFGVKWKVKTHIMRANSARQAVSFTLKKLPGETVLSSQVIENEEGIKINLDSGQYSVEYESLVNPIESFNLSALENSLVFEKWHFTPSPIWKVQLLSEGGLVPISNISGQRYSPSYSPWPGEKVKVMAFKPEGASGNTMSLISSEIDITPGKRLSRFQLDLHLLTSKGSTHPINLPEGATLDEVKINGKVQSLSLNEHILSLPLGVGKQDITINWHLKRGIRTLSKAPTIDVGLSGVNHKIQVRVPRNRWVLALGGPVMGPAVLFWGKLITLIIVAFFLGRLSWCPLGLPSWAVLFIGMTQAPSGGIFWITATLLFLCARKKWLLNIKPWLYNIQTLAAIIMSLVSVGLLLEVLRQGLLGSPIMNITGNGSSRTFLTWFVDRHETVLPNIWVLSTPQWVYQVLMLIWAIWMSLTVVKWVPWLWQGIYGDGFFKTLSLSWKKNKGQEKDTQ